MYTVYKCILIYWNVQINLGPKVGIISSLLFNRKAITFEFSIQNTAISLQLFTNLPLYLTPFTEMHEIMFVERISNGRRSVNGSGISEAWLGQFNNQTYIYATETFLFFHSAEKVEKAIDCSGQVSSALHQNRQKNIIKVKYKKI